MWQDIADDLCENPGLCMLLGDTDTGKSTLAAFLASYCAEKGRAVAVVDADVGQSDIGPPGTIGMGFAEGLVPRLSEIEAQASYFVGSNSPYGLELQSASGTQIMVSKARDMGAEVVIIDTTGAVSGPRARRLKQLKIELVSPQHLIALQRDFELEHLLRPFRKRKNTMISRFPVLPGVRRRSKSERRWLRQQSFFRCFAQAEEHRLDLNEVALIRTYMHTGFRLLPEDRFHMSLALKARVLYAERSADLLFAILQNAPVRPRVDSLKKAYGVSAVAVAQAENFSDLLVGLSSGHTHVVGVGILKEIAYDTNEAVVLMDRATAEVTAELQMGCLRVSETGRELGRADLATFLSDDE